MKPYLVLIAIIPLLFTTACKKKEDPQPIRTTLQNDGYESGGTAIFLTGFDAGDEGAVTLGPVNQNSDLITIQFMFGGSGNPDTRSVVLKIYNDTLGAIPGSLIYSSNLSITASDTAMQKIDVSAEGIQFEPGKRYRVSIETTGTGYPALARDNDGNINATRNWLKDTNGWVASGSLGITGDWIIRAVVEHEE